MNKIIAISGSLRRNSYNSALLRAAHALFPDDIVIDSIKGIPLYNGDVEERDGVPEPVKQIKDRIAEASGLLLATPEYNNAIPGVFKNAIDWLSRPPSDIERVFHDKPVAVIGATPGGFGTALAQSAWLPVLRTLKMRPWFEGRLMVSHAGKLFADDGQLTDEESKSRLQAFVDGFIAFTEN